MMTPVLVATLAAAAVSLVTADDAGLKIVDLSQSGDSSTGTGQISAAGSLEPFGGMGLGCGINWAKDSSFGGNLRFNHVSTHQILTSLAPLSTSRRPAGWHGGIRARRWIYCDGREHDRRVRPRCQLHLQL